MFNIIRSDLYRVAKSKSMIAYYVVILILFGISVIGKVCGGLQLNTTTMPTIDVRSMIDLGQLSSNLTFYYLFLIPVVNFIIADFREGTIKNTISSAISKKLYFITKFVTTVGYTIVSYTACFYLYYAINRMVNGDEYTSTLSAFSKGFFRQLPLMICISCVFCFIAFLVRKMGVFNSLTMLFPFATTLILSIMFGFNEAANSAGEKGFELVEKLSQYEISSMMFKLVFDYTDDYLRNTYIICGVLIVLSFVGGYYLFMNRELD